MKRNLLPYLAGFFDGEGCITISPSCKKKYVSLNCYVTTAGEVMPRLFQFHFGGSVKHRKKKPANPNWHDYWSWQIASIQANEFLKSILPYLILKKPQAEVAIRFQDRVTSQKHGPYNVLSDEERAVRQAEIILMKKLKTESYKS